MDSTLRGGLCPDPGLRLGREGLRAGQGLLISQNLPLGPAGFRGDRPGFVRPMPALMNPRSPRNKCSILCAGHAVGAGSFALDGSLGCRCRLKNFSAGVAWPRRMPALAAVQATSKFLGSPGNNAVPTGASCKL